MDTENVATAGMANHYDKDDVWLQFVTAFETAFKAKIGEDPHLFKTKPPMDEAVEGPVLNHYMARVETDIETAMLYPHLSAPKNPKVELMDIFLAYLPDDERQRYTCRTCRKFINDYGGLVSLDQEGTATSIMWDFETDSIFKRSVEELKKYVEKAAIQSVFYYENRVWGEGEKGGYTHLSVTPGNVGRGYSSLWMAAGKMQNSIEDFTLLSKNLYRWKMEVIDKAIGLFKSKTLINGYMILPQVESFKQMIELVQDTKNVLVKEKLKWFMVAVLPPGPIRINNGILGYLFDDLKAGKPANKVKSNFNSAADPTRYMRSNSKPSDGNLDVADKLIIEKGLAKSFERRYARLEDLELIWEPGKSSTPTPQQSLFGHLKSTNVSQELTVMDTIVPISMRTFMEDVAPDAKEMAIYCALHGYCALVTAVHPDAPSIIKWSTEEAPTHLSWYTYPSVTHANKWNLEYGWNKVTGIVEYDKRSKLNGNIFLIEGCMDSNSPGLALFPATLRSDLHEIRKSIEAFSVAGELAGKEDGNACGIPFSESSMIPTQINVTSKANIVTTYNVIIYK